MYTHIHTHTHTTHAHTDDTLYAGASGRGASAPGPSHTRLGQKEPSGYMPRDRFVLYSCAPGTSELAESGTRLNSMPLGPIKFDHEKYESWVQTKTYGRQPWTLGRKEVAL